MVIVPCKPIILHPSIRMQRHSQFKTIRILLIFLVLLCSRVHAHVILGERIEWVQQDLPKIEQYFQKPLDKTLLICVVPTKQTYKKELLKYKIKEADTLIRTSYAVTSAGNVILINSEELSRKHFLFVLAHEMAHQYQFERYGCVILHKRDWMEQDADRHARNIVKGKGGVHVTTEKRTQRAVTAH